MTSNLSTSTQIAPSKQKHRCPRCGGEKPLDAFYRNRSAKYPPGRDSYCVPCRKAYHAARRDA